MLSTCVKAVQYMGSVIGKLYYIPTWGWLRLVLAVHIARVYARVSTQVTRIAIHKMCSVFTPVIGRFMLIFHSTYNKQLRIT
jgi:hypothetical protein